MPPLFIVYHLFQAERWEQVFCEQIGAMYASGLLDHAHLTIGVNGDSFVPGLPDGQIIRHVNGFSEKPSLLLAREIAEVHPDAYILYCHSKGISHPSRNQDDWRMMMQHFLIVNWELAISYLKDYDLATVNWRTFPVPHPSGNCWWARASHLSSLPLEALDDVNRSAQEFWTGMVNCKVANLSETELNHYTQECPPSKYTASYFGQYAAKDYQLSYSSRADVINEGKLAPVFGVDFF